MQARRLQYKNRWFCYIDLLGFTELVRSAHIGEVVDLYDDVISKLEHGAEPRRSLGISYSWFSDTFIIFSRGDTIQEFSLLEQAGRQFFQRLILAGIPARGAISHGALYSNLEKNIFIGAALIEAYEYGEDQDWLGLLLAPSVYKQLEGTQLDVRQRSNYRPVPQEGVMRKRSTENVFAFALNNATVNGANPLLSAVRSMKYKAPKPHQGKYERTERFITTHARNATAA